MKMTMKAAKAGLAVMGMTIRKRESEYRVNFKGGAEATAYYTDDLGDALGTGLLMAVNTNKRHCWRCGDVNPACLCSAS